MTSLMSVPHRVKTAVKSALKAGSDRARERLLG